MAEAAVQREAARHRLRKWWSAGLAVLVVLLLAGFIVTQWDAWFGPVIDEQVRARMADPATRADEARRLGELGVREAVPLLAELATVENPADRAAAAAALGNIGGRDAILMLETMSDDADTTVRLAVARALGEANSPLRPDGLQRLLDDDEPAVRAAAVAALPARSGDAKVVLALQAAAADVDAQVRRAAIVQAAQQPAMTAYDVLSRTAEDADADIARAAAQQVRDRRGELALLAMQQARMAESEAELLAAGRVLKLLAEPSMATTLLGLLDTAASRDKRGSVPAELEQTVTQTLAAMGEPVLSLLVNEVILSERSGAAERAAREAMRQIGPPAAAPIANGILAWRIYPDPEELKQWVALLGEVGDISEPTIAALNRAGSQAVPGMDAVLAEARAKIEKRTGRTLLPFVAEVGLPGGEPSEAAWTKIGGGPITVSPLDPQPITALPDDGVVHLTLADGITWSDQPSRTGAFDIDLVLTRRDGQWEPTFHAYAMKFNKRIHEGRIVSVTPADGEQPVQLHIEMKLNNDLWRHAAYAEYIVTLSSTDAGLTGRFQGTCNEEPRSGPVTVRGWPTDFDAGDEPPLQPGEHPRLLFRAHHAEQLRQRIRTPIGRQIFQAIMQRLARNRQLHQRELNWVTNWEPGIDTAIGHGLLARLYDDDRHGDRAITLIIPRTETRPYGGEHGERYPGPMSVYPFAADLMFEDYNERQLALVREVAGHMRMAFSYRWGPIGVFAVTRSVLGVPASAAVMMLHEPGNRAEVSRPNPPPTVTTYQPEQPPAGDDANLMTHDLQPNRLITDWLWAGRVAAGEEDVLSELGGREIAWPRAGDTFEHGGVTFTFRELGDGAFQGLAGITKQQYLFPPGPTDRRCMLFTVLEVEQQTAVMVPAEQWGSPDSRLYLHGRPLERGSIAILQPGKHRLLLEVQGHVIDPRFPAVRAGYAKALWKKFEWQMAAYEAARQQWEQTGMRQDMPYIFTMAGHGVRTALATGQAEARKPNDHRRGELLWPFISARWIATGRGLDPDTPWTPISDPANVSVRQMSDRELCFMMGLAPDPIRREMAAEFRRRYLNEGQLSRLTCLELVAALVHYPMDLEGKQ